MLSQRDSTGPALLSRDEVTMYSSFNNWEPIKMKPRPELPDLYDATFFMPPG